MYLIVLRVSQNLIKFESILLFVSSIYFTIFKIIYQFNGTNNEIVWIKIHYVF